MIHLYDVSTVSVCCGCIPAPLKSYILNFTSHEAMFELGSPRAWPRTYAYSLPLQNRRKNTLADARDACSDTSTLPVTTA